MSAESGFYKGIQVQISDYGDISFFLQSIRLRLHTEGDIEIKVFDLLYGDVLDTFPISVQSGKLAQIEVNKSYAVKFKKMNLFIGYDAGIGGNYQTLIGLNSKRLSTNCGACGKAASYVYEYAYLKGAKLNNSGPFTQSAITNINDTGGLSISYSLPCSAENVLCSISPQLALPLLYKTGALVMEEMLASNRLTAIVLNGKEGHEKLLNHYEEKYKQAYANVARGIQFPDSPCFRNQPKTNYQVRLP